MRINTTFQHDVVAVQSDTELHLLVELTSPDPAPTGTERQPLHLALALDRSGSMSGPPLEAARKAASFLVGQLHDEDQLALVTYDDTVRLEAPLGKLDRDTLHQRIAGIHAGGSTNLSGGWLKAAEELGRAGDDATGIRRVLLLSDGHANQGVTDRSQLTKVATTLASQGITLTTIGFGEGFDEELLTMLADAGRGGAHYAASSEDLPAIFGEEFDDLVSLAAQNVSVELRPTNDVEIVQVLNTHPATPVPGGVQIQVGDTYAGQSVRLVVKLRIPAIASLGLANVGEVVLRWVSVGDKVESHTVTTPLVVNAVSSDDAATVSDNPQVVEEVTVLLAGQRAAEARRLAEEGRFGEASALAMEASADLRSVGADHPAAAQLFETAATMDHIAELMATGGYTRAEAKDIHYRARRMSNRKRDDR